MDDSGANNSAYTRHTVSESYVAQSRASTTQNSNASPATVPAGPSARPGSHVTQTQGPENTSISDVQDEDYESDAGTVPSLTRSSTLSSEDSVLEEDPIQGGYVIPEEIVPAIAPEIDHHHQDIQNWLAITPGVIDHRIPDGHEQRIRFAHEMAHAIIAMIDRHLRASPNRDPPPDPENPRSLPSPPPPYERSPPNPAGTAVTVRDNGEGPSEPSNSNNGTQIPPPLPAAEVQSHQRAYLSTQTPRLYPSPVYGLRTGWYYLYCATSTGTCAPNSCVGSLWWRFETNDDDPSRQPVWKYFDPQTGLWFSGRYRDDVVLSGLYNPSTAVFPKKGAWYYFSASNGYWWMYFHKSWYFLYFSVTGLGTRWRWYRDSHMTEVRWWCPCCGAYEEPNNSNGNAGQGRQPESQMLSMAVTHRCRYVSPLTDDFLGPQSEGPPAELLPANGLREMQSLNFTMR